MTHLFRDVLHGWGGVLLAVCASPAARDYDETARVLRYACLASQIGTAARAEPPLRALRCGPQPKLRALAAFSERFCTAPVLCKPGLQLLYNPTM